LKSLPFRRRAATTNCINFVHFYNLLKKHIVATIIFLLAFVGSLGGGAQGRAAESTITQTGLIKLFAAADESSELVAALAKEDRFVPLATGSGLDGAKWYLVKTDNGLVGWVKDSGQEEAKKLDSYFRPVPVDLSFPKPKERSASPATAPGTKVVIPITTNGSLVMVRVTFNNSVTANLALDTGATTTLVSRRIARDLGLSALGKVRGYGVGGSFVGQVARVDTVRVGEAETFNLVVAIHDFSPDPRVEGLLGLDFLNRFEMSLDTRKRQLFLTPR
jgi:hypothetical protein